MGEKPITFAKFRIEPPKTKTITILQPVSIPPRPKWMDGEPGYVESVARSCPSCGSNDVWRGPWCTVTEINIRLVRMEPTVSHSGKARHCACRDCGIFRNDFQGIPYKQQDEVDV